MSDVLSLFLLFFNIFTAAYDGFCFSWHNCWAAGIQISSSFFSPSRTKTIVPSKCSRSCVVSNTRPMSLQCSRAACLLQGLRRKSSDESRDALALWLSMWSKKKKKEKKLLHTCLPGWGLLLGCLEVETLWWCCLESTSQIQTNGA